ncbi:DUF2730 family protein [Bosea sp. 2KB_26]|uniref:DUF2730 family protein n=1 Tax=Bosea sp. 2KB_26 TaxID=3237475 RepID=UPI003F8FFFE7
MNEFSLLTFVQTYGGGLALVGSLATMLLSTKFVTREAHASALGERDGRLKTQGEKIEALEDRVFRIESEIKHLPDKDTAHRMEMAISRLEGRLETMDERLKPVASMATRMQDFMMDQGARAA